MSQKKTEQIIKALDMKLEFDAEAELEFIKQQAQAAATYQTYKWVV